MTDKYHIVQNIDSEEQGKYELIATIDNLNDEWVIEDIKVDIEVARNPKNRYKKLYEKYKDILIIANKKIPLSSDFVPSELVAPDVVFRFKEDVPYRYLEAEAAYAIEDLFAAALEDEIELYGASGYRSYNTQKIVFESNVAKYGEEEANTFSARPGESEHQTGLSLDVTSRSVNMGLTQKFADTKEGKWLKENAYKHGFIIRYPKGKEDITGYMYEPWHLRYVGKEVAEIIDSNDLTLEEFLKSIDVIK
ncbi:MAG: D-alanyl-D-alanine carboxypeptidase family protein [Firmicutes bacterium]|nr:D-alanyl-D-alanine carboxypeptidase family protein [Bacillota bacterium]